MNGSVFSKARNINRVGFEILARTPIPQSPPSYPTPLEFESVVVIISNGSVELLS